MQNRTACAAWIRSASAPERVAHCAAIRLLASVLLLGTAMGSAAAGGCKPGFVAREAVQGDAVCVLPTSKARAAAENARAPLLWTPGPFGPKTCAQGFVWRDAFVGDLSCVTPDIRTLVRQENQQAADNRL